MEKQCFKCKKVKLSSEFYDHPGNTNGLSGKCKECTKESVRTNYASRRSQYAEYERQRCQDPLRKEKCLEYQRVRRNKYPEKNRARAAVRCAIKSGKLIKQPCQFCGNPNSQAHHKDYTKPLDVKWACFKCHREKYHDQVVVSC